LRELRHNPLTGQWIIVSSVRAQRRGGGPRVLPFRPGAEKTGYGWDVLDLPNRLAALSRDAECVRGSFTGPPTGSSGPQPVRG